MAYIHVISDSRIEFFGKVILYGTIYVNISKFTISIVSKVLTTILKIDFSPFYNISHS